MNNPTKRHGRRFLIISLALVGTAFLFLAGARARGTKVPDLATRVARGEYLVNVGGCNDCHTPWVMGPEGPGPDATRTLSGHPHDFSLETLPSLPASWGMTVAATNTAFAGPWGLSFAANLTPCLDTGTGAWTEEIFINTIRSGRHWGQSRPILPPMPWPNFARMSDEDLASVFAYLRSLPAHRNEVPEPLPPGGAAPTNDPWL